MKEQFKRVKIKLDKALSDSLDSMTEGYGTRKLTVGLKKLYKAIQDEKVDVKVNSGVDVEGLDREFLYIPSMNIVVIPDNHIHKDTEEQSKEDEELDIKLKSKGYTVHRIVKSRIKLRSWNMSAASFIDLFKSKV